MRGFAESQTALAKHWESDPETWDAKHGPIAPHSGRSQSSSMVDACKVLVGSRARNPSHRRVPSLAGRCIDSACTCLTFANHRAKFEIPWGCRVESASKIICDVTELDMSPFIFCDVPRSRAMLLRLRMLSRVINGWACKTAAAMANSLSVFNLADVHTKPDKSCEDQELPVGESFRLATPTTASHSNAWESRGVPKSWPVYASFWAGSSGSCYRISSANASDKAGSAAFSLACHYAVWARSCGVARVPEACHAAQASNLGARAFSGPASRTVRPVARGRLRLTTAHNESRYQGCQGGQGEVALGPETRRWQGDGQPPCCGTPSGNMLYFFTWYRYLDPDTKEQMHAEPGRVLSLRALVEFPSLRVQPSTSPELLSRVSPQPSATTITQ